MINVIDTESTTAIDDQDAVVERRICRKTRRPWWSDSADTEGIPPAILEVLLGEQSPEQSKMVEDLLSGTSINTQ